MDAECVFLVLLGTVGLIGLELWAKVRLGAVVCSLDTEDEDKEWKTLAALLLALTVGVMVLPLLYFGASPSSGILVCILFLVLAYVGLYPLLLALTQQGGGAKLGEGGIREPYGPRVYRWRDIRSYEWTGREGCDLILHVPSDEYSPIRLQVSPAHKVTVDRYLTRHVPRKG